MQQMERELSLTEVFKFTFEILRRNFRVVVVPYLIGAVTLSIVILPFWPSIVGLRDEILALVTQRFSLADLPQLIRLIVRMASFAVVYLLLEWVIKTFFDGVGVKVVDDAIAGKKTRLRIVFSAVTRRLFSLLAASFLVGLLVISTLGVFSLGLILGFASGSTLGMTVSVFTGAAVSIVLLVVFALLFSMVLPAVVIEGAGGLWSLIRSKRLTSRRKGKVFAIFAVYAIILMVFSSLVEGVLSPLVLPITVNNFVKNLANVLPNSLYAIILTTTYHSLRAREMSGRAGLPIPTTTSQTEVAVLTQCPNCGAPVLDEYHFCTNCGHRIRLWT